MDRTTNIWPYSSATVSNQCKPTLCCSMFAYFGFNVFSVFSAAILDRRYEPKTLVCNPIQSNELKNITYQFEENCAKIEDVRVPHWKTYKKAVMTSSNQKCQNLRKVSSQFSLRSCGPSFIKIGQELWKWEAVTDRHTHILTHRQGSFRVNIFSSEMTEYKNVNDVLTWHFSPI